MDANTRKQVLRSLTNGMYVVTSRSAEGHGGATVTWMTQTSFEPPLLVAAVRQGSGLSECLQSSQRAVVHVVAADQVELAKSFFARPAVDESSTPATLAGYPYTVSADGVAVLDDSAAFAECRLVETVDCGGDHQLVVLEVTAVTHRRDFEPLTVRNSPWEYGG